MESGGYHEALAALAWQVELGADEAILDAPVDRYDLDAKAAVAEVRQTQALAPRAGCG